MRAQQLIRDLGLQPHPEGGHYAEVHRSPAVTSIYFLLASGEISRWHRIRSEEIWHFYEGAPLELLQLSPDGSDLERIVLGPSANGSARFTACRACIGRPRGRAATTPSSAARSRPRSSSLISRCSAILRPWPQRFAETTRRSPSSCSL